MSVVQITKAQPEATPKFDAFWTQYPKKVSIKRALSAWDKLSDAHQRLAIYAIADHVKLWKAQGTEREFIPYPASWLNAWQFLDEIEIPKPAGSPPQVGVCGHSLQGGHMRHSTGLMCLVCWNAR